MGPILNHRFALFILEPMPGINTSTSNMQETAMSRKEYLFHISISIRDISSIAVADITAHIICFLRK